ncbi:MAG: hypothetical protein M3Y18_03855, partial [Candidatus Eremiobacteraeota bacterium]|nr:hypothetical protein [Candidatus Eremiobacteraeota bacterium]
MFACLMSAQLALARPYNPAASNHPTFSIFTQQMTLEVSARETRGKFVVLRVHAPPGGGPAAHMHT